jgi:glycosyltransferase involved in cell wall biosynthesis
MSLAAAREPAAQGGARRPATVAHVLTSSVSLPFLRGQVGYVKGRGFAIHAITSPGPELDAFGRREEVPVHAVEMPRRVTPLRDLVAVGRLWRTLRRIRPDVVHAATPKGGLLGMIAATLARAPVRIYHVRGLPFVTATGNRRRLLRATEWVSCTLAHRVLAVSHSMRKIAVEEGLCPAGKIEVLLGGSGNGVDADGRFRPQPETVRREERARLGVPEDALAVLYVGRLVRDKGVRELARAWGELREHHPRLHLVLAGRIEAEEDAIPPEVVAALRADPRVHLPGVVRDMPRLYAACDVVALPTYREGFPNVALEAAAMALPIVATDVPGCVDAVVDGETGILVPARDPAALRDALDRYLADPALRARHGEAARRRVLRDFRQEAIWQAVADEYERLLAARRAAAPVPAR